MLFAMLMQEDYNLIRQINDVVDERRQKMNPKTKYETNSQSLCVDTSGLQEILQSGRKVKIVNLFQ